MDRSLLFGIFLLIIILMIFKKIHTKDSLVKQQELLLEQEKNNSVIENKVEIKETEVEKIIEEARENPIIETSIKEGNDYKMPVNTTFGEKISKVKEVVGELINKNKKVVDETPVTIIRNKGVIDDSKVYKDKTISEYVKKDIISPNPDGTSEYYFIDEDSSKAWSELNVSQHPDNHSSSLRNELVNTGAFFDKYGMFHDKTSPFSENTLPDRCFKNENNEILCDYNNKLYIVPPKLIDNPEESPLLQSIGTKLNDIETDGDKDSVVSVNNSSYKTWNYVNEKDINGGVYFNGVYGSQEGNETYYPINQAVMKKKYTF